MITEEILLEAENTIRRVMDNELLLWIGVVVFIAAMALAIAYVMERWSWIPRKRQRARFDERLPEMATIPGPRHGEKVTVCGYEWTIM